MWHSATVIQSVLVSAILVCACNNASGQQTHVDELADAAARRQAQIVACEQAITEWQRRVEDFGRSMTSALDSISATRAEKPVPKDAWKSLEIGEFESKGEFEQRQAAARKLERDQFETADRQWKSRLASQERELEDFRRSCQVKSEKLQGESTRLLERLQASTWHVPALPSHRRLMDRGSVTLPRFDRESMSFWPVVIPASGVTEVRVSRPGNLVVRIEESSTASIRITLPSLAAAKAFKEAFESGQITCIVEGGLDMGLTESPILVKPEVVRYEEGTDFGAAALAIATGIVHVIAGSSPEDLERALESQAPPSPKLVEVVEQAEVKEAGTRFHFSMSPESVTFIDSARRPIADVRVSRLGDRPRVKTINPDAQPACRELQSGDQIIRVGDREVWDIRAIRSATRSFGTGESFDVTYRRAGSDTDRKFKANGGKKLGIAFE